MAAWVCAECTTTYSVGAPRCPHCGSTEHTEEGQESMPKITVHGGPSIAGASVVGGSWSNEGDPDVWPEEQEDAGTGEPMQAVDGGELTGDGSGRALPPTPDEAYGPDAVPLEEGQDYEALTVEQLKEQLGERGLPKSGKRDDLVQRLRDDDAARAAEPGTE